MQECIFCNIIQKKDAQYKRVFYEDKLFVALLVLSPQTKGHFIVMPKQHVAELNKMTEIAGALFEKSIQLAEETLSLLGAKAYVVKVNNNVYLLENDPMHVGHTHMHVVPRFTANDMDPPIQIDEESYFNEMLKLYKNINV